MDSRPSGIVLAGGQSLRMGQDKASLPFGETSLVCWVVRRITPVCGEVIVVARQASDHPGCGVAVIGDRWPGAGPLGGLVTGVNAVIAPYVAVLACDLPFVEPALLAGLAQGAAGWDAVVPRVGDRAQPLCAIYHRDVMHAAEVILSRGGRSLHELLKALDRRVQYLSEETLRAWDPALRSFENINTPDEYVRAKQIAEAEAANRRPGIP